MLKCASPAVLINLQCPTTQVRGWIKLFLAAHRTMFSVPLQLFCHAWLMGFLIKRMCCLFQLCVSKCPDRFATLLDARNTKNWEYYKQFCKPGFDMGSKVRGRQLWSAFSFCTLDDIWTEYSIAVALRPGPVPCAETSFRPFSIMEILWSDHI